ncbi:PREDICTED: U4/U6 small nuclear ribonucleoprotein PRP4-like protein [Camelina sativa]|uniref:U4/U6 small nuclear ribonucleoprotein PRP4-like protein n=1 Tax=Camelina sativa TaxID=90675 RepID=A0ABM0SL46_CAMSA|nr:PREDICTED: U4/U6 small nuclear ribonucleoprotein PRP4-like protein [Camelina sativa]
MDPNTMQDLLVMRPTAVPTNDKAVRDRLRRLGKPITLFGEQGMERRSRLSNLMGMLTVEKLLETHVEEEDAALKEQAYDQVPVYPFFTEGPKELREARIEIAKFSIKRAAVRNQRAKRQRDEEAKLALNHARDMVLECSNFGEDRPLTGCSFSRDGKILATCSLSGVTNLWEMPQVTNKIAVLEDKKERATDVVFSPVDDCLATASADRTAKLWKTDGTLVRTFEASCGLDSLARVWDLRTGRSILVFQGKTKPLLSVNFSPNGYHLASGGEDNQCRIWDLRMRESLYTIAAHSNLVSQVKYEPQAGHFLATASYDKKVNIWSGRDFSLVKSLAGHESKVASLDITPDSSCIATVSHDRTIKLWTRSGNGEDES